MAKHSSNILELAARGAKHRYEELQAEITSLVKQFPNLRKDGLAVMKRGRKTVASVAKEVEPKQRRKVSAKARKAMGDAQRKRWAKVKAQTEI
jgi:seryl-tRNA synthetase